MSPEVIKNQRNRIAGVNRADVSPAEKSLAPDGVFRRAGAPEPAVFSGNLLDKQDARNGSSPGVIRDIKTPVQTPITIRRMTRLWSTTREGT